MIPPRDVLFTEFAIHLVATLLSFYARVVFVKMTQTNVCSFWILNWVCLVGWVREPGNFVYLFVNFKIS
jgi:hypothetical protein